MRHLPIWLVETRSAALGPIAVPAFRHRGRRLVLTLATQLTRRRVAVPREAGTPLDPAGAYLDEADARAVARFVAAGIDRGAAGGLELRDARLAWWPFERLAGALREPVTRFALPVTATPARVPARRAKTGS